MSRQKKTRRNDTSVKVAATLTLAVMAFGKAWIMAEGFGELYDAPLSPLTSEAVAVAEEYSVVQASNSAESVPTLTDEYIAISIHAPNEGSDILTDEYIAEVMSYERPHVLSEGVSASGEVNTLSDEENASQPVAVRYALSDEERDEVERVMMAECGGEERDGMIAVGQCILNACEESGLRPHETLKKYGYTHIRKEPSEAVKEAVCAVFDRGETITGEPILYFYADYAKSPWHESQQFVMQIGVHRFFEKRGQEK